MFTREAIAFTASLALVGPCSQAAQIAATEHRGPELLVPSVSAPIVQRPFFLGPHELYGYHPRFAPNVVTFDDQNRPWIRTRTAQDLIFAQPTTSAKIQTLDPSGTWIEYDLEPAIVEHYNEQIFQSLRTQPNANTHVVSDQDGDLYTLAEFAGTSRNALLMHSTDRGRSWTTYELPTHAAFIEHDVGHNPIAGPPGILVSDLYTSDNGPAALDLINPTKRADGTLLLSTPISIARNTLTVRQHSGGGNFLVRHGTKTHVVYGGAAPVNGARGTPQYIVTYDHATRQRSDPVLLDISASSSIDVHDAPAVAFDSQGYLHVVTGQHHGQLTYTRSLAPNSIDDGWTIPVGIGPVRTQSAPQGGSTYVGMVIDEEDTIHVVTRSTPADVYRFDLVYFRKKADLLWEKETNLVIPDHINYSNYYHKLNIDPQGRLFLNYSYYANRFSAETSPPEAQAYLLRWPEDPIRLGTGEPSHWGKWEGVTDHGPVILMSDDGGDSWRIALTEDFLDGMLFPTYPEPGDNGGRWVTGADLIALQQNFGRIANRRAIVLGDANQDGRVSGKDLIAVQNGIGLWSSYGDANDDGWVTGADLIAVMRQFGNTKIRRPEALPGDIDQDGQVSGADLIAIQVQWGRATAPPTAAPVPEPSGLLVLMAGWLGTVPQRKSTPRSETTRRWRIS